MRYCFKKILSILCLILMITFSFCNCSFAATKLNSDSSSSKSLEESNLTPNDWKIVIDDKNKSGDFSFIQNNEVAGIFNSSDSLLIYGIIFLIIGTTGLITTSIIIIKKRRKLNQQKAAEYKEIKSQRAPRKRNSKYKH